ncbi:MAG TPA: PaREP1 family protein [Candidatus Brocadiia bacterium]|nr:PaREP1 family protein [Candidatus Brocadiales bacterium]
MQQDGQLKRYITLHQKYLNDADVLLRKGDYAQASEKLWGSTATLAKAIATLKKKRIKSHDGITFFLTDVAKELKDKSILNAIFVANGLHQNFYEGTLPPEAVEHGAKTIKQFSKRLRNFFNLGS